MCRNALPAGGAEVLRQVRIKPTFAVEMKKLGPRLADGQPANVVAHQESEFGQISGLVSVRHGDGNVFACRWRLDRALGFSERLLSVPRIAREQVRADADLGQHTLPLQFKIFRKQQRFVAGHVQPGVLFYLFVQLAASPA